jgi:hypothetical protein
MASDVRRLGGQWHAAGGALVWWIGATWHDPLATNVTREFTTTSCHDRWSLLRLGVRARRGYDTYGGAPTWPCTTSRLE